MLNFTLDYVILKLNKLKKLKSRSRSMVVWVMVCVMLWGDFVCDVVCDVVL